MFQSYKVPYFLQKIMFRQTKKPMQHIAEVLKYVFKNNQELTENQKKKCFEKFESFKALGSIAISKNELKNVLKDLGRQVSEEQLLQMIQQADPNGYGYVSYEGFERLVELHKSKKEEDSTQSIGLTFEEILKAEKLEKKVEYLPGISWQFLQKYLLLHYELQINIKAMKTPQSTDYIVRDEFKLIFS